MTTRPVRIAQTTTEAKKEYKKSGLKLSDAQLRQLHREHELDQRAARIREQEERKRAAKRKREENERKQREARRQLGIGLATQMIGYSRTQAQMKNGMEAFVGLKKHKPEQDARQLEVNKKLEAIAVTVEKEPWDDDAFEAFDTEDIAVEDIPGLVGIDVDSFIDDDLDDETLLEVHDLIVPDICPPRPQSSCNPHSNSETGRNQAASPEFERPTTPAACKSSIPQLNTTFKVGTPKLPASKVVQPPVRSCSPVPIVIDNWEDFLDSSTQIARELSSESQDQSRLECRHTTMPRPKSTAKPELPSSPQRNPDRTPLHNSATSTNNCVPITKATPPTDAAGPVTKSTNISTELGMSSQELVRFLDDEEF
ncbi:uncharacterized protein EI97DRAFT_460208 [Westerdykella ornata]|uniref:Uncharacterized protein n=1 Tax=Westerdykella ornata TaxID=318751 RepID=A0A6A6JDJ9_WESOR|nr:uncharacterized protein EI97DRAFT_460208 [Westerdykella ornata]KAF2274345.1 hypothetical protein EI97DRAFT_460208 [Westerdykella ornata]